MSFSKSLLLILIFFSFLASSLSIQGKPEGKESTSLNRSSPNRLVFAIDLIRHGDRTPLIQLPCDVDKWKEGLGELTPLGIHQGYLLGKKLRQEYVVRQKLLPPHYSPKLLSVRSTDSNRTLMTAQSCLTGFFPPGTGPQVEEERKCYDALPNRFQPIPIHTVSLDQDKLLICNRNTQGNFTELMEKVVYNTPSWKKKEAVLQPFLKGWETTLRVPLQTAEEQILIGDALLIQKLKKMPPPPGMSSTDRDLLIRSEEERMVEMYRNPQIGAAAAGSLFRKIAEECRRAAQEEKNGGKEHLRYLLYSAHDSTQLALMSALGAPLTTPPPYSSDFRCQLFEKPDHTFYVRLSFNEKPIVLPGGALEGCSLEHFEELAQATQKFSFKRLLNSH